MHENALGTAINYKEALKWFKKSVTKRNLTAVENFEYLKGLM
jgi:TPR repeat protein